MRRVDLISLISLGCLAAAAPAHAGRRCSEPYPPVIKQDASLSKQQIAAMRQDVIDFMTASDIYQRCLSDAGDPGRIAQSQAVKERVGREYNSLVRTAKNVGS